MGRIILYHGSPDEENGYLSNWYLSQFTIDGAVFSSLEQYMMYRKAVCFHDDYIAEKILATDDVARIKELGRLVFLRKARYYNLLNFYYSFTYTYSINF